jgi:hypothetical protein
MPDEGPALTNYQEAGQLLGGELSDWHKRFFGKKSMRMTQKQARVFARKLCKKRFLHAF